MAWNMKGAWYESCSCKANCRCVLGPAEPDQGWCSAIQLYEIERGSADGVDLSGAKMAVALQLPGDFFGGIEKGRIYFDTALSAQQRGHLEAIFQGNRGGVWAGLKDAVAAWLPSKVAAISVTADENEVKGSIAGAGTIQMTWFKTSNGQRARLLDAPVMEAFATPEAELANGVGSGGSDPELRRWESLGAAMRVPFAWSA
ncbi:MAG: DUF1326 domain-containing protein [Chloroflexi bacterium]|nr:DUF1326 domain-containing protein [Chloroflexota bacterium]